MLEKSRFLAIKNLAKDIRNENEKLFKAFEKEPIDDVIKEKTEFIESVIDSMEIAFSDGEQGKEERQVFRANVLIPDDIDFFNSYSKDKNIRNLMNKYAVSIEDIMSKITELNIYGKYIDVFSEEDEDQFVEEMVNLSTKEAESLLEEIEDLSNVMAELDIDVEEKEEPVIEEEPEKEEIAIEVSSIEDDFDSISNAVSGFVDEYTSLMGELDQISSEKAEMKAQVTKLENEVSELESRNLESADALNKLRQEKELVMNENAELKDRIKVLEAKLTKSAELIKKIYNSIPRK